MDYKSIIESKYNRKNWQLLLHDIFGSRANLQQQPFHVETSSSLAKSAQCLGKITLSDEQTIAVYEVELSDSVDIERNRRGIRDMLASSWRRIHAGAFMFCYRNNESVLRFSYVSESWTFAEDGTYKKESTDTKRFTYLLGEGHRSRTAIQQFEKLRNSPLSLKDLTKAFSVDAVGDMFFKEYKKNYEDIIFYVTGKRMVKVANKWEERQEGDPCETIMKEFAHFPNPEKAVRDYVKKLMGRLVFLQFLQKKGWLGVRTNEEWGTGDAEFIQNIFAQTKDKDHFIDNVLEALFNDLNSEDEKALPQYRTPYLNGGLFERDAQDETNFTLPAKYMQQMLDFFSSYNFTIDENDPDDAEVGVDPEMLGRIFENLLEDNKDKGAFYTPKEIVSYMCRESLIAYLQTDFEDETVKESIRQFVTTHDVTLLGNMADEIDQRLKDVKICDPAIGSGAFPMGLLKELFQCRSAIEGFDQSTAAEIKKHIIQNNIYGVDIEKGAVDIARLRFWLSLIVDEETPQALPNLDFKIMRGNSLLEQYKGFDLSTIMHSKKKVEGPVQMTFFEDDVDVLRRQVIGLRREYFRETNKKKKKELRQRMREIVQQQINALSYNIDLSGIDIADNSEFFLWHTWFSDVFESGGFDIVIGNPPYVSAVNMARTDVEKRIYKSIYPQATGAYDLYVLFLLKGCILSKNIYTWIIPNKFLIADYAELSRSELKRNGLYRSLDVSIFNVFKEASVYPIILNGGKIANLEFKMYNLEDYEGLLLNKVVERTMVSCDETILSCGIKVCSGATGFEAQRIKEFVTEYPISNTIPFTVSGNIDRYSYNNRNVRYMKDKYPTAYIFLDKSIADSKKAMWTKPKIVVAGMTKVIEATYVDCPLAIGVGAYAIYNFNGISPYYILGLLNSKYTSYYLRKKFKDKHLAGGYLAINKSTIEKLPFVVGDERIQNEIVKLVIQILDKKKKDSCANTSDMESLIDKFVYQLYNLTKDEITIIEQQ